LLDVVIAGFVVVDEVVSPEGRWVSAGGVPTYAGLSVASLGHRALAVSNVGPDGVWLLERLAALGIDASRVRVLEGQPTTRFRIERTDGGRRMWIKARCVEIAPEQLELDASAAYLGPVAWEIGGRCVSAALRRAGAVAIDPQGLMREVDQEGLVRLRPFPLEGLRGARLLRLSEEECIVLGFNSAREAALRLSERLGCDVLASSIDGIWVCGGGERFWCRVRVGRAVDTVGAGDVSGGAYLVGLLESGDRAYSLALALAAVSERVRLRGPQPLDGGKVRRLAEEILATVEKW
jgi:sugar/nucleoside kinase (ribokinase family)